MVIHGPPTKMGKILEMKMLIVKSNPQFGLLLESVVFDVMGPSKYVERPLMSISLIILNKRSFIIILLLRECVMRGYTCPANGTRSIDPIQGDG